MQKWFIILSLSSLVFVINHCSGPLAIQHSLPETSPENLINRIRIHASKLNTVQGNARLMVQSAGGNFQGTMLVRAHLPDSLYAKVEGPFGVDVAHMRLYEQDLLFYSPFMHMAYSGSLNNHVTGLLPIQMNTGDFMLQALGLLSIRQDNQQMISFFGSERGLYYIRFENGDRIWVHPKGPVITRWEKKDEEGKLIWTWEAKNFKKSKGVRLPQTIQILIEEPKQQITFFYTRRQTNKKLKSGWSQVKLPEGVEPIAL